MEVRGSMGWKMGILRLEFVKGRGYYWEGGFGRSGDFGISRRFGYQDGNERLQINCYEVLHQK